MAKAAALEKKFKKLTTLHTVLGKSEKLKALGFKSANANGDSENFYKFVAGICSHEKAERDAAIDLHGKLKKAFFSKKLKKDDALDLQQTFAESSEAIAKEVPPPAPPLDTKTIKERTPELTAAEAQAQKEEQQKTAKVQMRMTALQAQADAAGGTREEGKAIKLKFSQAGALLRSKDFEQAEVVLNEVDDLIKAIEPEDNFNDEEDEPLITPAELKGFMKKAANKPHPFACGMSKEGFDYTMNREAKKPKALAKAIKKATGATKLCWGTAELNGKTLVMRLQKKPIPGMLKHMKKWLKANKPLPANKAKFIGEDGNEILPSANEMAKELQEYHLRVTKALKDGGDPAIKAAWQAVMLAAKAKDFATAWDGLSNLDELLDATTSDVEKQWLAQEEELMSLYEEAMKLNPENRTKLTAAWEMARESADGGNYAKAMTIAAKLKPALEAVLATVGTEASEVVDWPKVKAIWQTASDAVDSQIAKLQSVLKKSNDEELVEIAEFGLNGVTGNFKVPLMTVIREIDGGSGDARQRAANKALGIVQRFHKHINSSNRVAAVDSYSFGVDVSIRSTLSGAFIKMEKALQAMVAN